MKLIRAVLRHSLLIAIVVAAGLAYYYRDELLPKFYEKLAEYRGAPEESEPAKTPTSEQGVEVEEEIVVTAPEPQPPAALSPPAAGAEAAAPVASPRPPAATPAVEPVPAAAAPPPADLSRYRPLEEESEETPQQTPVEVQPVAAPAATATPSIPTPSPAPSPVSEVPEGAGAAPHAAAMAAPPGGQELPAAGGPPEGFPAEAQAPAPVGSVQAPAAAIAQAAPDTARRDKLRIDARSAFWRHDYQQAEKIYQELIQLDPDDPDAYGELGNVYFSQGNWKAAGGAFYEAALRLIKSGQVERARRLLTVIRGLDPERARELEQQLATAQGGTGN